MSNNEREIIGIVTTKRSAHHAFINWYLAGTNKPFTFFNDIEPTRHPKRSSKIFYHGTSGESESQSFKDKLAGCKTNILFDFQSRFRANIDLVESFVEETFEVRMKTIIYLRDPINFLASLCHRWNQRPNAETWLRLTNFKPYVQALVFEEIVNEMNAGDAIVFSGWRYDRDYRRGIADRLGIEDTPPQSSVTQQGGGSSFVGRDFDTSSREAVQQLLSRWKSVCDDPSYLALFRDDALVAAFERYFDLAGDAELLDRSALDDLKDRALRSEDAGRIARRQIGGLRNKRRLIELHDRVLHYPARNILHSMIQLSTQARY